MLRVLMIVAVLISTGCNSRQQAQEEAQSFCASMNIAPCNPQCMAWDTDNDGYVSCTVLSKDGPMGIDCSAVLSWNSGCRMQRAAIQRR